MVKQNIVILVLVVYCFLLGVVSTHVYYMISLNVKLIELPETLVAQQCGKYDTVTGGFVIINLKEQL